MKPGPFAYHDPGSIDDLVGLLSSLEDAKLLAGGQSLMPMLNMRFVQPDHVIDLNTVAGLDGVRTDKSALTIGAMTRQVTLKNSKDIADKAPLIAEALDWVGHFQTRTRGTIGGSLSHLDPSAELPLAALVHDAELTVRGPDGERSIAMAEWPLAYMTPNIGLDEVLTEIRLPLWNEPHGTAFIEFARRHGDFAIVAVACMLAVKGGKITRAAIGIGGAMETPYRLNEAEQALIGEKPDADTFKKASEIAHAHDAMSDAYINENYRKRLARVLTERALAKAAERAGA